VDTKGEQKEGRKKEGKKDEQTTLSWRRIHEEKGKTDRRNEGGQKWILKNERNK